MRTGLALLGVLVEGCQSGIKPFVFLLLERREGRPILGSLLVAFVVSFTVAGSVALGITAAYASVIALLHAFAHNSRKPQPRMVLVPTQNQASGD
jgi:hypothetical protein